MLNSGRYYETIIEMISNFRYEVQAFAVRGLFNINKHSENFVKGLLNLTYEWELENLNMGKSNFPGIDLGDTSERIAFQITSTKKSDKIENTLATCLAHKHYESFREINIFILTKKQESYTIKTITEPHFAFSQKENIWDFDDLLNDIEQLGQNKLRIIHDYIKAEVQPTLRSIQDDKPIVSTQVIEVASDLSKTGMTTYTMWQSETKLVNKTVSVPDIYFKLNQFLGTILKRNQFLPVFNSNMERVRSRSEILYRSEISQHGAANQLYAYALRIEPSKLTNEKTNYSNNEHLLNLTAEMLLLLTQILFLSTLEKAGFKIEIKCRLESNAKLVFDPRQSLVKERVMNLFELEERLELNKTLTDVDTKTLCDLLQDIMHFFISRTPNFISREPFLAIDTDYTAAAINNIKNTFGITN